uniref:Neurotransmitter-gated ion-channel transmembrane domain-containing protein n=1 Tax=Anopheles farauti TaxID=69004 RepID=A0A182QTM4_9DIPT
MGTGSMGKTPLNLSLLVVLGTCLSSCVVLVHGSKEEPQESITALTARSDKYYDEMWYRWWTFPVTMAIKAKVIAWVFFITFFSTIMQAIVYQKSEPQLPEIYTIPEHAEWGHTAFTSWG